MTLTFVAFLKVEKPHLEDSGFKEQLVIIRAIMGGERGGRQSIRDNPERYPNYYSMNDFHLFIEAQPNRLNGLAPVGKGIHPSLPL